MPRQVTAEEIAAAVAAHPRAGMKVPAPYVEPAPAPVAAPAEPEVVAPFTWTDTKRARLLSGYVNTGDLLQAQRDVGCTPSEFNAELRGNDLFRATAEAARKDARATLRLRALSDALAGNDRLLTAFVKESDGEDDLRQLTDAQLTERLNGLLARIRARLGIKTEKSPT